MSRPVFPVTKKAAEKEGIKYSSETNKNALFPYQLRELRKKAGVSQDKMAQSLGVSKSTLGLYETGDTLPDARTLRDIAAFFNVSTDYLVGVSSIPSTNNDTRDICEKTGLSEHTISRLMQDDKRNRWAEVIDQLLLHPGLLEALHIFLFFDIDYFSTLDSNDRKAAVVLRTDTKGMEKSGVPVYPRMMDGALMLEVQRELSDIKRQLKKARTDHAKEKG